MTPLWSTSRPTTTSGSLNTHVSKAYQEAIEEYGAGSTASRLICGTTEPHRQLERTIASAKGTEAALSFATGYATSVGVITALLGKGDTIILDKLCHASLIDGARMSGATLRVFPHNNLDKLNSLLESATAKAALSIEFSLSLNPSSAWMVMLPHYRKYASSPNNTTAC